MNENSGLLGEASEGLGFGRIWEAACWYVDASFDAVSKLHSEGYRMQLRHLGFVSSHYSIISRPAERGVRSGKRLP
jgi:hypothetical protein